MFTDFLARCVPTWSQLCKTTFCCRILPPTVVEMMIKNSCNVDLALSVNVTRYLVQIKFSWMTGRITECMSLWGWVGGGGGGGEELFLEEQKSLLLKYGWKNGDKNHCSFKKQQLSFNLDFSSLFLGKVVTRIIYIL